MRTRPWLLRKRRLIAANLCLALLTFLAIACVKVRPSVYQLALQRYYGGLLTGSSESQLRASVLGLTEDLKKNAADPGLHILRTAARLELLRLGAQTNPKKFSAEDARDFFEDLRQTQSLLDQIPDAPLWMRARVPTMFGDALLLQSIEIAASASADTGAPAAIAARRVRRQIVLLYLYQLAGDWFLQAGTFAGQSLTDIKGKDTEPLNKPGLSRELDNARDGYVNALNGMAQSERFLQLLDSAQTHLMAAQNLLSTAAPLPRPVGSVLSMSSFYAYPHSLMAIQARALEELNTESIPARIQLRGTAIREEIATRLLSNPMQEVDTPTLTDANLLALYLSSLTLEAVGISLNVTRDANTESVAFTIRPNAFYRSAGIAAFLPFLNVQIGDERRVLSLPATAIAPFSVPATAAGVSISVFTRTGTDVTSAPPFSFFLGKSAPALASGKQVVIKGPGDYTIATATVP